MVLLILFLLVCIPTRTFSQEAYTQCVHGDVRLVDGEVSSSASSGRVEVCIEGLWERVGGNEWDRVEATVVCRQLGFFLSQFTTKFVPPPGNTSTGYFVQCNGQELNLINCTLTSTSELNDVLVNCSGPACKGTEPTVPQTEVSQSTPGTEPTVSQTRVGQSTPGTEPTVSQTRVGQTTPGAYGGCSCYAGTVGGVLGSIIVVLLTLLTLCILALTYPHCIRPRLEQGKHLPRVMEVLDRTLHNPTYSSDALTQQPQQNTSTRTSTLTSQRTNTLGHHYEAVDSASTPRERGADNTGRNDVHQYDVIADATPQLYESVRHSYNGAADSEIDPTRYEVSEAYNAAQQSRPKGNPSQKPEVDAQGYSHLKHQ